MQDFHPIPGLSGRIFPGSDPATRRLRNYPSAATQQQQDPQSPIQCPRCNSANTKFCYYNNYNLSQPRHFCKSCRRYWTKGGVLRNVPVGGGCRKNSSKRSASNRSKPDKRVPPKPTASGSSSESSSTLTASNPNPDPILEQPFFNPETTAGSSSSSSFTTLMAGAGAGAGAAEGFNFSDPAPLPGFRAGDPDVEKKLESSMGQQQAVDLQLQGKEGLNGLDWVGGGSVVDSGSLFDITSSVDPAAYWNQTHWGDTDPSLYLP